MRGWGGGAKTYWRRQWRLGFCQAILQVLKAVHVCAFHADQRQHIKKKKMAVLCTRGDGICTGSRDSFSSAFPRENTLAACLRTGTMQDRQP
uniref:Putative secreted protein n=1 Tax=Ixodes ricinus TaxID=34613 RepID=A0A6B0UDT9_IXORI